MAEVKINIPDEHIAGALQIAFDGAIAYWCADIRVIPGHTITDPLELDPKMKRFYEPLFDGKWLMRDTVSHNRFALNRAAIARGLDAIVKAYHPTLSALITCKLSPRVADELVQCALFGRVLYAWTFDHDGTKSPFVLCTICNVYPCRCRNNDILRRPTMRP